MKRYILIAGVNGAGKSTLYQTLDSLKELPRVNTDEIVKTFGSWKNDADTFKAGKIADGIQGLLSFRRLCQKYGRAFAFIISNGRCIIPSYFIKPLSPSINKALNSGR